MSDKGNLLHQLLAVHGDLKGVAHKISNDQITLFTKKNERFLGEVKSTRHFADEDTHADGDTVTAVDTDVKSELDFWGKHIQKYLDCQIQIDTGNQLAKADLVVEGVLIKADVPVATLRVLECRIKEWRNVLLSIPTLAPGINWVPDTERENTFKNANPEVRFVTKKVKKFVEVAAATKEHPAQVHTWDDTEKIGKITVQQRSSMMSVIDKANLLEKLDRLLEGVKRARASANALKVEKETIGQEIVKYLLG